MGITKATATAVDERGPISQGVSESSHRVAIRFHEVGFAHGAVEVLKDSSFHVHEGEFVALVGPNGAGKTSILRLIMGLAKPQSGSVEVFGKSPQIARGSIGYVPQYMNFDQAFPISVEEVVRMGRLSGFDRGCARGSCSDIDDALELAGVADLRRRSYSALSGGQRRRVLVARALASKPRLLILDEPTANMDSASEERLFSALGDIKGSTTILIATHDTAFVSALTDVVLCVGERAENGHDVVRHAAGPVEHVSSSLYGGNIVQVLHDTEIPDNACCACAEDNPADVERRA
jgi:zinc transport system ATP-binding protein